MQPLKVCLHRLFLIMTISILNKAVRLYMLIIAGLFCFLPASALDSREAERMAEEIDSLMAKGQWESAEKKIVSLLKSQPDAPSNGLIFSNLGVCHANMGRYEDALEDFDIALLRFPDSSRILANKARTLLIVGRNEEALAALNDAIEIRKNDPDLFRMRGILRFNMGKFKEAQSDFDSVLSSSGGELREEAPEVLALMARTALALGENERASELYELIVADAQDADLVVEALCFFLENAPDEKVKTIVNEKIKQFPEDGRLYLVAAVLCERSYLHSEADLNKKIANQYGIDSQTIEFFIKKNLRER